MVFTYLWVFFYNDLKYNKIVQPYITQSWLNTTNQNEAHHQHEHPNSFLSGVDLIKIELPLEYKLDFVIFLGWFPLKGCHAKSSSAVVLWRWKCTLPSQATRNFIALDGNETSVAITENIANAYSNNINVQVILVMWTQSVK